MLKRVPDGCPDLETIAAYLDHMLGARERARVTEHLASCAQCYAVFSEALQAQAEEAAADGEVHDRKSWLTRSRVVWASTAAALATAAAVVLVVGGERIVWKQRDGAALQALIAAVGADRPIDARLSGGFAYGPARGALRSGAPAQPSAPPDVRIAAAEADKLLAANRTASTLHLAGVGHIAIGDVDGAVPLLERAVEQPRPDAPMLSDLAAAYLAVGARDQRPIFFEKALAAADHAVKVDPNLPEALFNRALALENLALVSEARAAWQEYLRVDSTSGWAAEARRHLNDLG